MNSLLLSNLTKDFLSLDPALTPGRERYRMGWSGSVLTPHAKAPRLSKRGAGLLSLRERFRNLFGSVERPPVFLSTSPRLARPLDPPPATYRPVQYFSRGAVELDRKKNPEPIPYLLVETNERAKERPVPGNSFLLRSLCKGKGVLRQNNQGLVFLDVNNQFISMMLPYLKVYGLVRPPYFHVFDTPEGAHVPVIPAREIALQYLHQIEQMDREFSFEIEGLFSMEPLAWPEVEQVWFFKLRSEGLEDLRRSYFLPGLPGGHAFHIAVAVKPRLTKVEGPRPLPLMRINTAFLSA